MAKRKNINHDFVDSPGFDYDPNKRTNPNNPPPLYEGTPRSRNGFGIVKHRENGIFQDNLKKYTELFVECKSVYEATKKFKEKYPKLSYRYITMLARAAVEESGIAGDTKHLMRDHYAKYQEMIELEWDKYMDGKTSVQGVLTIMNRIEKMFSIGAQPLVKVDNNITNTSSTTNNSMTVNMPNGIYRQDDILDKLPPGIKTEVTKLIEEDKKALKLERVDLRDKSKIRKVELNAQNGGVIDMTEGSDNES